METYCYGYVREAVEATNPDLILVTGDLVYGKFDETGSVFLSYIEFMESLEIPWAPVFGNHDNECLKGVDWQCAQLEAAEYCLFKQGNVTGNGNYSVGIKQNEEILRVFYMMDSNGCSSPMIDRNGNHTEPAAGTNLVKTSAGFAQDQIDWYTEEINAIHAIDADVKISFAYHIQQAIFQKAFEKYDEYDSTVASGSSSALKNPLNLDTLETADETDFGYIGRKLKGAWDTNYSVWNGMKALGVDSLFVGHEHCNSASIVYEDVRFQYGQKSSTYDRFNWVLEDGTIQGDYQTEMPNDAHELMGGTVIPISSQDGSIGTGYIYYAGDPFNFEPVPETPFTLSVTQGDDRREMPTYDGDATALGFPAGTGTVYAIASASWSETNNTAWDNRIVMTVDAKKDYVKFEVIFSANAGSATVWPGGSGGTLGSYTLAGSTVTPSTNADANRQIIVVDADGAQVTSFKANTLYTFYVYLNGNEINVQFSAFANTTIYVANIDFADEETENTSIVQGDGRTAMPTYGGDVTALGFTAGSTVYTIDNATADGYGDGWAKRAILYAPATQDYVTLEFVTQNDITGGVFHAWGEKGSPSLTHVWCNTTGLAMITDMNANSVSSIQAGTHYLLHVACQGLNEVQIGFISANNTVYFTNITFYNGTIGQPSAPNPDPDTPDGIVVNGVELINPQSGVALTAEAFDATTNAYKATATAQGKVYIDTSLVANKSTITFTVYVSEIVNTTAFMVRIKPNDLTEDGVGHLYYTPSSVAVGTWQTFTVDISHFGSACTEFSFIIPAGQTVWFRDITIV